MAFDVEVGRRVRVKPTINMAPLVDVVLVLLIIFMVITPMMVKQFWTHVPKKEEVQKSAQAAEPSADEPVPVVLSVRVDGTIWINKDRVSLADLPVRLERIFAARSDHLIFFDADDALAYGAAMEVLDAARGGGASHIAILTEPLHH